MKSENYLVIQGWMITELKLKGNELMVYALIYGFSQDGSSFTGSLQYIADWCNGTKQGVIKNLKNLVDKGLLKKKTKVLNGVTFCEYYATEFNGGVKQSSTGGATEFNGGVKQSLTNNIINKIDYNIDNNIEADEILTLFNLTQKSKYTGRSWIKNFTNWKKQYTMDEICQAIQNIPNDKFWKDKMTPEILFRQKNTAKEPVDYIGMLLNQKSKKTEILTQAQNLFEKWN